MAMDLISSLQFRSAYPFTSPSPSFSTTEEERRAELSPIGLRALRTMEVNGGREEDTSLFYSPSNPFGYPDYRPRLPEPPVPIRELPELKPIQGFPMTPRLLGEDAEEIAEKKTAESVPPALEKLEEKTAPLVSAETAEKKALPEDDPQPVAAESVRSVRLDRGVEAALVFSGGRMQTPERNVNPNLAGGVIHLSV